MEIPVVKLVECPRDAMQGIETFIPTDVKVKYLNGLLKVGFDTIDIGSFVSPKAIPQLAELNIGHYLIGEAGSTWMVRRANSL